MLVVRSFNEDVGLSGPEMCTRGQNFYKWISTKSRADMFFHVSGLHSGSNVGQCLQTSTAVSKAQCTVKI